MKLKGSNYAFIDSQNVNLAIRGLGWQLDWARFRVYLKEKYGVSKAFLFLGYLPKNQKMYDFLKRAGYVCIFKPTLEYKNGITKGNVDAELVLHAMIELENFSKAIIVSGDGDFYCLAEYLIHKNKLEAIIIPNEDRFSALLKFRICKPFLRFMNQLGRKMAYDKKEKAP